MRLSEELQGALSEGRVSKQRQKLFDDAKAAGFTVKQDSDGTTHIVKGRGKHITRGITIWPDGTATRADTGDLSVVLSIRGYKNMREALGLK